MLIYGQSGYIFKELEKIDRIILRPGASPAAGEAETGGPGGRRPAAHSSEPPREPDPPAGGRVPQPPPQPQKYQGEGAWAD